MLLPNQSKGVVRNITVTNDRLRYSSVSEIAPSDCDFDCGRWDVACKAREAACRARCGACRTACRSAQAAAIVACADLSGPAFAACEAAAITAGNECYNGCC
jgi:hypothetical protein